MENSNRLSVTLGEYEEYEFDGIPGVDSFNPLFGPHTPMRKELCASLPSPRSGIRARPMCGEAWGRPSGSSHDRTLTSARSSMPCATLPSPSPTSSRCRKLVRTHAQANVRVRPPLSPLNSPRQLGLKQRRRSASIDSDYLESRRGSLDVRDVRELDWAEPATEETQMQLCVISSFECDTCGLGFERPLDRRLHRCAQTTTPACVSEHASVAIELKIHTPRAKNDELYELQQQLLESPTEHKKKRQRAFALLEDRSVDVELEELRRSASAS